MFAWTCFDNSAYTYLNTFLDSSKGKWVCSYCFAEEWCRENPDHMMSIAEVQGSVVNVYCGICDRSYPGHKAWNAKYVIQHAQGMRHVMKKAELAQGVPTVAPSVGPDEPIEVRECKGCKSPKSIACFQFCVFTTTRIRHFVFTVGDRRGAGYNASKPCGTRYLAARHVDSLRSFVEFTCKHNHSASISIVEGNVIVSGTINNAACEAILEEGAHMCKSCANAANHISLIEQACMLSLTLDSKDLLDRSPRHAPPITWFHSRIVVGPTRLASACCLGYAIEDQLR